MSDSADRPRAAFMERWRERRRYRHERREWRRERRKGSISPYDAHNRAESSNYRGGFFKKD